MGAKLKSWGPAGDPLVLKPAGGGGKYVAQMVGASISKGVVHHELLVGRSYKGEDVRHFLQELREKYGAESFAVFLDNASIHKSDATLAVAAGLDIPLLFNLPYCPEYNGLENLWLHTKAAYKQRVLGCM